jgi:glutathione reductase (NADPH)
MQAEFDLVVVGSGTAAMTAAMRVREAGWRVAVIDFRPFGGTCALRGCDPKKMLVGGAEALDHARRMHGKGLAGDTTLDWPGLMAFKRSFTDPVPQKHLERYASKGIDTYHGEARFIGRNQLAVGAESLAFHHVLLACGAEPVPLGIPGEQHLVTNEGFLAMERLPRRIVLVGGGYIAAEFSHIAARAGSHVVILQQGERMLKAFDPQLVGWLMEKFAALGIDVHTGTKVKAVDRTSMGYIVHAATSARDAAFDADLVVHAAGRAPALAALDLAAAAIDVQHGRIVLNEYLQSVSNPAVYAAGDAAQVGPPLTPVSSHDAKVVAANLLKGNHRTPDYTGVPSVAFTVPPIAMVGLGEEQARKRGLKFRMQSQRASDWFAARQAAEPIYGFKVLVDEKTDHILGAHLVGPHADEVITSRPLRR